MKTLGLILSLLFLSTPAFSGDVGAPNQILRMPSSGHRPGYGAIDLSQSSAVGASVLGYVNGGTGLSAPCTLGYLLTGTGSGWSCTIAPTTKTIPTIQSFSNAGNTTTGTLSTTSPCVTSVGSTKGIGYGMGVIDSTHNSALPTAVYVAGVPGTCSSGQVQLSQNAAIAETGDTLIFGSQPSTTGTISSSSVCITSVGSSIGIVPGAPIVDLSNPSAVTQGTYVTAIPGTCSSGQIQMNAIAAASESGDTLKFGQVYTPPSSPSPLYVEFVMVGGGGAGANSGTGSGGTASFVGTLLTANGGAGGLTNSAPSAGGTVSWTATTGLYILSALQGGSGDGSAFNNSGTWTRGGTGAASPLGGAGGAGGTTGGGSSNGGNAIEGTGSGGGGAGGGYTTGIVGGGGAAGGYIKGIISSLSSSYPIYVGVGGTSGSGSGADGTITFTEKYQ